MQWYLGETTGVFVAKYNGIWGNKRKTKFGGQRNVFEGGPKKFSEEVFVLFLWFTKILFFGGGLGNFGRGNPLFWRSKNFFVEWV